MEKLNVCLINDSFPPAIDGVANAVTNYAKIINSGLGEASVTTPFYPNADDSVFNFPVIRYPSVDTTKLVGYRAGLPFSADIQEKLVNSGFDIIHSHCPITSTMLARALRERINVPIVFTYHTKFDIDIENAVKNRLLQEEAARILVSNITACDEVWTVSKGAGDNLKKLGYEGDYIVMPNGVDFPVGRVDESLVSQVSSGYDLPAGVPVFLFVGRMMWYKGIRITLDALKLLKETGKDFRMIFVGGGADKEEIVSYCEKLGLSEKVFFIPPIQDRTLIRAWYCKADLFLFPSTFDTNGLVVREAAACALGSVLVRGSCAAEDCIDRKNALFIEENAQSMFEMLVKVCDNPALMKEVGENAQKDIYISWDDAVRNAYNRYGIVVENYRSGAYKHHETLSGDVIRSLSLAMSDASESKNKRHALAAKIIAEYGSLRSDIIEGRADLRSGLEKLLAEAAAELKVTGEELDRILEEIYQDTDRYK